METAACTAGQQTLDADGILPMRLDPRDLDAIRDVAAPFGRELEARRARLGPEQRAVAGASMRIAGEGDPRHVMFEGLLRRYGVLELCRRHKGMPYRLRFAVLQHNTHEDRGLGLVCSFEAGVRARSYYAHIDAAVDSMKVIVYLTPEVTAARGALRYFIGSHCASDPADLAIRKSNDRCGWENVHDPADRRAFAALPPGLQRKANFGNDLLDPVAAAAVLRSERPMESSDGDLLLFDPDGAHRGAMFEEPGERRILQLSLAPAV